MVNTETTDEFCGCLIAIDCEDDAYLQGEILGVDPLQRTINLGRPLKDGCPMGIESFLVLPTTIRELKILKMPSKNNLTSSDESHKKQTKTSSPVKMQEGTSVRSGSSSEVTTSPKKSISPDQPSCSFESRSFGANGIDRKESEIISEKQLESSSVHGKRIDVSELLKPSLQLKNSESAVEPGDSIDINKVKNDFDFGANWSLIDKKGLKGTDEFCGCLIAINCEDESYLQGEILGVDPLQRTINLGRPLRDGCPMGVESFLVLPTTIRELKILKMPSKNNLTLSDESHKKQTKTSLLVKMQEGPSVRSEKGGSSEVTTSSKKSMSLDQPSCSFESRSGANGISRKGPKITSEKQLENSSVHGKRIDVNELLKPSLQPKSGGNGQRHVQVKGNSYVRYGEYKLFNNQQVAAPRVLQVSKSRSAQEPSGMPLIDCSNGYSGYRVAAVELGDPIDFNELKHDFDFSANLALFNKDGLAQGSPEDAKDGKTLIVTKNFRNDENILSDPKRIISWTKAAASGAVANEYVGRLITISCGELGNYQGKVVNVDSEKQTITIERPFKDGMPVADNTLTLLGSDMRDLRVHDNPVMGKNKSAC